MSRENVERSRAYLDQIARASEAGLDPEATVSKMAESWAPEVEWDMSEAEVPDIGGVYRGIEASSRLWREWFAAWETLTFEYELVDGADHVVWLIDLRMRGRSTGIEVSLGTMVGETGVLSRASEVFGRCVPGFDCLDGKGQNRHLLAEDVLVPDSSACVDIDRVHALSTREPLLFTSRPR